MFNGSQYFYYAMYLVGFALMMILNIKEHDRYGIEKKDAVLYTVYTYVCGIVGAIIMGRLYAWVYTRLGYESDGSVAIFGAVIFTPLLIMLFPINRKNWKNIMDMLTPGILLILACAKIGCFVNGCCRGIVCNFGIHYTGETRVHFPVQIFEAASMFLILAISQFWFRKSKRFVSGTAYPITFLIYSITRFFWEYLRYYWDDGMKNILFGLDFWQLVCLVVVIISSIFIIVLNRSRIKGNGETK